MGERGRAWRKKKKMGKGRGVWGTGVGERGERGRVRKKERERFWIRVHVHLCGYMVKIYWFPSLSVSLSLFSFLSSLLPSSSLFLSLSSLSSTIPSSSSSLPFSSLPYPPLPLSPLRYRAGMDNPVIALRFGLLLEMYCRGSPNHMVELQQQVQWIGWAIV